MNKILTALTVLTLMLAVTDLPAQSLDRDLDLDIGSRGLEGVVRPAKQVSLMAPLEGILATVLVEETQTVDKDQVLAQMDDAMQQVVVESATLRAESDAEIRRSNLLLEEAKISLERITEAYKSDAANEWEVRRAKLQVDEAQVVYEAAIEQQTLAKVNLKLEREKLSRYAIRAPFAGTVYRVEAQAGATLRSPDPVLILVALDPLEAHVYVPVELLGRLAVGQTYTLRAGEPVNSELQGKLKTIDPVIDTASDTIRCVFTIANADHALRAGFKVRLMLTRPADRS